ncbi:MAG: AAA family ATPase [Bdellovibrionales bacterium]|nr:AAA family ATPase [Bdellovibrionales bacterium]
MKLQSQKKLHQFVHRDNHSDTLARLLRFYLACIEEEDLRSLRIAISQYSKAFISTWNNRESFFNLESAEEEIHVRDAKENAFLMRGQAQAGEKTRLFYGYPVYLDESDYISPLFFTEVELDFAVTENTDSIRMRPLWKGDVQLNHHFLRQKGLSLEEVASVQERLEGPFGSFSARLGAALSDLGVDNASIYEDSLDELPKLKSGQSGWLNRPILFRSSRGSYTANLRSELGTLQKYPSLLGKASDTALNSILAVKSSEKHEPNQILEVCSLNSRQREAVRSALGNELTVVTGPPGTGKSQVVINIMASAVLAGKSVLFASYNNKAVDVVKARLSAILNEGNDWVLRLGNRRNFDSCKTEMMLRLERVSEGQLQLEDDSSDEQLQEIESRLDELEKELEDADAAAEEYRVLESKVRENQGLMPRGWSSHEWAEMPSSSTLKEVNYCFDDCCALNGESGLGLWLWLQRLFMGPRLRRKLHSVLERSSKGLPAEVGNAILERFDDELTYNNLLDGFKLYRLFVSWLKSKERANSALDELLKRAATIDLTHSIERLADEKTVLLQQRFRHRLSAKVHDNPLEAQHLLRRYFDLAGLLKDSSGREEWLKRLNEQKSNLRSLCNYCPLWIVTNLSVRQTLPLEAGLFDILILDEASQCDVASALPLLYRAKKVVVIGDPKQLRHISTLRGKEESKIARKLGALDLLDQWSYNRASLYDVAESRVFEAKQKPVFLSDHYRSHPDIVQFSNDVFYKNRLNPRTSVSVLKKRLAEQPLGLFWSNVQGSVPKSHHSAWNPEEIAEALRLFESWHQAGLFANEELRFGFVTPFRLQMDKMESAVRKQTWWNLVQNRLIVGTAHQFQGDEVDLLIFSTVVAPGINKFRRNWVASTEQLLNVAVTRARGVLHIVGNINECVAAGGFLQRFAEHVSKRVDNSTFLSQLNPAERRVGEILEELDLWSVRQYPFGEGPRYFLDYLAISPCGNRYDIEIDGLGHFTQESLRTDEIRDAAVEAAGYRVIRVNARDVFERSEVLKQRFERLV